MFELRLSTVDKDRGATLATMLRAIADEVERIPDHIDWDECEEWEPVFAEDGWFIERHTYAADGKRNGVWVLDDSIPTAAHKIGDTVAFVGRVDCMAPLQEGARGTVTDVRWEAPMPHVEYAIDWFEGLLYETDDTHWDESQIAAV
ncbi:hypothetical protein H7I53_22550 [Mycolicibacterium pulveris]|uniref:Uncharacterized protein n=1 Tax=Mycolicibacterium pulveris TaxID=36813 RepID=A0A7I7UPR8_MYCPV|nr:hypothetical protein [Mycolicibacterium pulveris]MCV6982990.1 hypothetical protein [Mycolicibacterium pulveris]BBY82853.1 hypothetical protein MPUL_40110 [Mycolicibacterium pulveris]